MENKIYKRQYRELTLATRKKISNATKGKSKSEAHKAHISRALKDYWRNVPSRPKHEDENDCLNGNENNCDVKPSK